MATLTQDELKSLLMYDPASGVFTWVKGKRAGHVTGTTVSQGYVKITVSGKMYAAHRLAWLYIHGYWPPLQIDHINQIRSDNRIDNLRLATCAQNHQNRRRRTRSTSGFLGVTWHKRDRRWQAHIEINGAAKHLGLFVCLAKALRARKQAEQVYHPYRAT